MKRSAKKFTLKTSAVLSLALVGALSVTSGANASGVPVIDGAHLGISKFAWIEQYRQKYEELQKQIEQYKTQIRELEQKFVRGNPFQGGSGYRETLAERSLNDFVANRCGSGGGLSRGPDSLKDVILRQYANCVAIVQTENTKYNVMVRVLRNLEQRDRQLETLKREAADVPEDEPGRLERINSNIAQLEAYVGLDIENAKTLMDAYDASLRALNTEQIWLAEEGIKGKKSTMPAWVGQAVQYGALKAALQGAKSRER